MEVVFTFHKSENFFRKLDSAFAAFSPYFGECNINTEFFAFFSDKLKFRFCIGRESVDCNHAWESVILRYVFHVLQEIWNTLFECFEVFVIEVSLCNAAVIFQCSYGCNNNCRIRSEACFSALDVNEFFCSEVSSETCFRDNDISEF